jgi:hypothetical protein
VTTARKAVYPTASEGKVLGMRTTILDACSQDRGIRTC